MNVLFLFDLFQPDAEEYGQGEKRDPDGQAPPGQPLVQRDKGYQADEKQCGVDVAVLFEGTDSFLINLLFHDFDISLYQCVKGNAEQFADHQQAVDVRIAFVVFPAGDGLPGNEEALRQFILGHPLLVPEFLQPLAKFHVHVLLAAPSYRNPENLSVNCA
jgi:hypothetical protein